QLAGEVVRPLGVALDEADLDVETLDLERMVVSQRRDLAGGQAELQAASDGLFEDLAGLITGAGLLARLAGVGDNHAAAPLRYDETVVAQLGVRTRNGVAVDRQVCRQHAAARQPIAILELARLDHVLDLVDDLLVDWDARGRVGSGLRHAG